MKYLIILFLLLIPITLQSQIIQGQVIELKKTKYNVGIPEFIDGYIWLETEIDKIEYNDGKASIPLFIEIENDGRFNIDISKINGDLITLYLLSDLYTYLVLRDIPKSQLSDILKLLPVLRNVIEPTCGKDCFTINSKKTYKAKILRTETSIGTIKYFKRKNVWKSAKDNSGRSISFFQTDFYYEFNYGE